MIWMSWRQFRAQAMVAAAALIVLAVYLVILGTQLRHAYTDAVAQCQGQDGGCGPSMKNLTLRYGPQVYLLGAVLVAVPGILGMFWGAPLVARELEAGTHRMAWNQSVTRRRWLVIKLLVVGLCGMAATGLFSLLVTWAASPFDRAAGDRFTPLLFGSRNLAPVAYAAFAVVLGALLGLLIRRTVPALAVTALVFVVVQIVMPTVVRPQLIAPITVAQPVTAETIKNLNGLTAFLGNDAEIRGLEIPGGWVLSNGRLLAADGGTVPLDRYHDCVDREPDSVADCLAGLNLHVEVSYQPGDRYWSFQWLESAIFLALGVLLAGVGLWRIQRVGT